MKQTSSYLDGSSRCAICEGEGADIYRASSMFSPYWESEVHGIISREKTKETTKTLIEAQIKAAKK